MHPYVFQIRFSPYVDWRARRIGDPVERLRYLRQANRPAPASRGYWARPWTILACCAMLAVIAVRSVSDATGHHPAALPRSRPVSLPIAAPDVWVVENHADYEIYSNGLRVENRLAVSNLPRSFVAYDRADLQPGPASSDPAGIVYHTSESQCLPFEAEQNGALRRAGQGLLSFVRDQHAYHFVIDRFGRVYRIVRESDVAFHAGHSVWADSGRVYLELNSSFLGIAFEGETERLGESLTPAQIHAGRTLTEMLRSRYHIAATNCVTHAQVSVNPDQMRIGYHVDWAGNFPFREMGLEDNYALPVPALYLFGYGYGRDFVAATGARLWKGLILAEDRVREEATLSGRTVAEYRKILQKRYREKLAVHALLAAQVERAQAQREGIRHSQESIKRETHYESEK